MKKLLLLSLSFLLAIAVFAQAPERMSFQAVIRNSSNALVPNAAIGMRISILQGSTTGTAVYVELHTPHTDGNGVVSLEIGGGSPVSGSFASIPWGNGPFFVKTETDITGGSNYSISGTSQLLSVPYALYAKSSGSSAPGPQGKNGFATLFKTTLESPGSHCITGGIKVEAGLDTNSNGVLDAIEVDSGLTQYICNGATAGFTAGNGITISGGVISCVPTHDHFIGEAFGGGIIFYLWKDSSHVEHGLIVSDVDISSSMQWSSVLTTQIGNSAQSSWDGTTNTSAIINQSGHTNSAALSCFNYAGGGHTDWYLPSIDELSLLWHNRYLVNKALGGFSTVSLLPINASYWSSTEYNGSSAWVFVFNNGNVSSNGKSNLSRVRAIRAF